MRSSSGAVRFLEDWSPIVLYTGLIFTLSSIPVLAPPGGIEMEDKIWHVGEYLGWGLLCRRALDGGWPGAAADAGGRAWRGAVTLLLGAGLAVLDENFQRTVGRHYAVSDMIADWAGLILALPVYEILGARSRALGRKADAPASPGT